LILAYLKKICAPNGYGGRNVMYLDLFYHLIYYKKTVFKQNIKKIINSFVD